MKAYLFLLVFTSVFSLLSFYIYKRLIIKMDLSKTTKNYLKAFLFINLIGIVLYGFSRYYLSIPNWLFFLLSLPIGVLFLLFCATIFYDIFSFVLQKIPLSIQRRTFLKKTLDISVLSIAGILGIKSIYSARFVELERVTVKIKKLKKSYKIVQISDVHIGGLIDAEFIKETVSTINKLEADIVVITGDLIDTAVPKAQKALDELKKLQSKYGTYFIVGNHEYFHNIHATLQAVKDLGIKVLENENVYIGKENEGFNLVGVYDVFGYRVEMFEPDIKQALKNKKDSPTVLLAHQPKYISELKKGVDLMLSGHTHGGQIYPFKYLVKLVQPYERGLHQHNKNLQIYVNKGTGFWGPPMRLGASSEITLITIES